VVVVDTNLAYENGAAAGTGMVLTSSGEILTIKVAVPGHLAQLQGDRGRVQRLEGRRGDPTAERVEPEDRGHRQLLGTEAGAKITAVGNAGGRGSSTSATGTVTGLARSVGVQNDSGGTEQLSGLVETNADLQPGDSGGPLLDSAGKVVGMDTAGSVGGGGFSTPAASDGLAIPINTALALAKQIESGTASTIVHIGTTPFLGVGVEPGQSVPFEDTGATSGLILANVVSGGSAAEAGLATGDAITAVDGKAVNAESDLQSILLAEKPGDKVAIDYSDTSNQAQSTTATLAARRSNNPKPLPRYGHGGRTGGRAAPWVLRPSAPREPVNSG
jgi:S1-C subfamily serine protease